MALIALRAQGFTGEAVDRSVEWLHRLQRPDGGWRPRLSVDESTWVTSLALLVPGLQSESRERGLNWLLGITGRESWRRNRLRAFLLGYKPEVPEDNAGWPWYPDTAGWVMPTSVSMLAVRRALTDKPSDSRFRDRFDSGSKFLIARRCTDGGWNHGSSRALGHDLPSYPESTGQALLALRGIEWKGLETSLGCAEKFLDRAASVEAVAWLRLGLLAHGRATTRSFPPAHTPVDVALQLIVDAAERGMNPFA